MASIEFIEKRIQGKEKELDKLNKKLERILKAEASNYEENNPYYYTDYDKRACERDIKYVENDLTKYREQLAVEIEKQNSRNVPAIVEFLEKWKERMKSFYTEGLTKYYAEKKAVNDLFRDYDQNYARNYSLDRGVREQKLNEYDKARKALYCKLNGYKEKREFINHWGKQDYADVKVRDGEWEHLRSYSVRCQTLDDALTMLEKDLEQEKNAKYDFIIQRVNKIVGQIIDAYGLRVGVNGELNGIIIGTKGKASVETIGAGGYRVQCFHYRVLISEVK